MALVGLAVEDDAAGEAVGPRRATHTLAAGAAPSHWRTRPAGQLEWAMDHMREEIRIEAPVDQVWAFLCDTSRWHDWMPRGEFSDFSGPYDQVGTTYAWKMKLMGFEMKGTSTVLEVVPQKLIHERTDTGMQDNYFRFEPDGGATRLVAETSFDVPGHLPGFLKTLLTKSFMERQMRHMLGDFKALAEAKVPVPA